MDELLGVISVANGLFEQLDGWDFYHMLGEIGAELQAKCTYQNRILHQKCLYGKNGTDGPLPECITTGRLGIAVDWWQERLALIVGRVIIHARK